MLETFTVRPHEAREQKTVADEGLQLGIYEGTSNHPAIDELKRIRAEYVRAAGWFPDAPDRDDTDRYDGIADTIHFATYDRETAEVVTSMRLTKIDAFEDALSWNMAECNPEMAEEVRNTKWKDSELGFVDELDKRAQRGNLWDLTRLVNQVENRASVEDLLEGLIEMIGAGIERTAQEDDSNAEELTWVFMITPTVKAALDMLGIRHDVLTKGKVSAHDNKESYFCVAYPYEGLRILRNDPETPEFTMNHLEVGLIKANAL